MKINQKTLELLKTDLYNLDFKSGNKLVKCKIKVLEDVLLVTDERGERYLVDSDSIEKISAFRKDTRLRVPRTKQPRTKIQ